VTVVGGIPGRPARAVSGYITSDIGHPGGAYGVPAEGYIGIYAGAA
jgi:hypothetical protein